MHTCVPFRPRPWPFVEIELSSFAAREIKPIDTCLALRAACRKTSQRVLIANVINLRPHLGRVDRKWTRTFLSEGDAMSRERCEVERRKSAPSRERETERGGERHTGRQIPVNNRYGRDV